MALPSFIRITDAVDGGYVPIREGHLDALATACRGPLVRDRFGLRAWAAQVELLHRFGLDEEAGFEENVEEFVRDPSFDAAVARMMRTSKRAVARQAITRLVRASVEPWGWDDDDASGRIVPVPRRALRKLASGASAGALAVYLHACKRGSFKYGARLHLGGLLRATDAARTWGLNPSSAKRGRASLVAVGLLEPVALGRRFESANGWPFLLPDRWEDPEAATDEQDAMSRPRRERSAPPPPDQQAAERIRPESASASRNARPSGSGNGVANAPARGTQRTTPGMGRTTRGTQRTTPGNPAHHLQLPSHKYPSHKDPLDKHPGADAPRAALSRGSGEGRKAGAKRSPRASNGRPSLHVDPADLDTPAGREALCDRIQDDPTVDAAWKSEAGRLTVHAVALQVLANGRIRDACAVVAEFLRGSTLPRLTDREEDAARSSQAEARGVHEGARGDPGDLVSAFMGAMPSLPSPPARFPADEIRAAGRPAGQPTDPRMSDAPAQEPAPISPDAALVAAAFDRCRMQGKAARQ